MILKNELNWGAVGAGDVFKRKSGPPLYEVSRSNLVGITRRDQALGESIARDHGCSYFPSLEEMLKETNLNAVYIASPPERHLEHALAASHLPALVEKPMAMSTQECREMVEAFHEKNSALAVAYYRRGYPSIRKMREVISKVEGEGELWINDTFPTSHRLDLVRALLGSINEVRLLEPEASDSPWRSTEGPVIEAHCEGGRCRMTTTWGENGDGEKMLFRHRDLVLDLADLKGGDLWMDGKQQSCDGLPWTHWGCIENFVAHVLDGEPLLCDGEERLKSTAILDVISRMKVGDTVEVDMNRVPEVDLDQAKAWGLLG